MKLKTHTEDGVAESMDRGCVCSDIKLKFENV